MTYGVYTIGTEDYGSTPVWAGSSGAMPITAVEVAFTTGPGATPAWIDIGERLKQFTVHRGRPDDQSAFSPGQATITLNNEDRAFDPQYASSPYYPNVVPMRRIRIRATWAGVVYDVFNGYVTNWRQTYDPPADAECTVEASDAFKVLSSITLPASVWAAEVLADGPVAWFRLGDPSSSTSLVDSVAGRTAPINNAPTLGTAGLVAHDSDTALTAANTGGNVSKDGAALTAPALISGYPMTLSAIIKPTVGMNAGNVIALDDGSGNLIAQLFIDPASGFVYFQPNTTGTFVVGPNSTASVFDGNPHLIAAVWDGAGNAQVYIDGAPSGAAINIAGTVRTANRMIIGGQSGYLNGMVGIIDEAAVFNKAVSATRQAAWSTARATPWNSDLSGTRVGRILDAAGWPAADRNIDTGVSVLQSADGGMGVLEALQKVEQTEAGAVFITANGQVRFISRSSILSAPYTTSQATFGDSGSELEYGDLSYTYDDHLIFNEVRVSRSNGVVQTVSDATSQTSYLRRTRVIDGLLHQTDSVSLDRANWELTHYKDPTLRVTDMKLEPARNNQSTHFPQVLGRELLDRVTVLRRPQNLGAAIQQDVLIEGISHDVTAVDWVTTWNLSPGEAQTYWLLGVAGNSELEQTTRLAF